MANLTEAQCRAGMDNDLSFKTSSADLTPTTYLQILNEVAEVYYNLVKRESPSRFLTELSIDVSAGTATVADLDTIDVQGGGIFEANSDGTISDIEVPETRRGSSANGWWMEDVDDEGGAKIHWTPSIATGTRWAVYIPYRTVIVAGADTPFPARKQSFITRALLRYYWLWRQNPVVNLADAEFQNALRQILGNSNPHHSGVSLDLDSF